MSDRSQTLWRLALGLFVALMVDGFAASASAHPARNIAPAPTSSIEGDRHCGPEIICPLDDLKAKSVATAPEPRAERVRLLFFWGVGCPHCEEAKPFLRKLQLERPRLDVERIEVKKDRVGRKRFVDTMRRLGAKAVGVPTFVVGSEYVVGFSKGVTEKHVTRLVDEALGHKQARHPLLNALGNLRVVFCFSFIMAPEVLA